MQKVAEILVEELKSQGIPCAGVNETDNRTIVNVTVGGQYSTYGVVFIFNAEHDVEIAAMRIAVCPENKRKDLYPVLNDFNSKCRWGKLVVMPNGDVNMRCDAVISEENVGGTCVEIFLRITHMVADVYPSISKVLWS